MDTVIPAAWRSVNTLQETDEFSAWLSALADRAGKAHILARLARARAGNFGNCEPVGEGVSEMRIDLGPGYRVYLKKVGTVVYLLLCAGTKSTQKADIRRAKSLASKL
ncbi:type II toxin-antitoxin system RelE/ParE family toxin [Ramlibacter sp. Leaf400]|uniref:type II toxin-antitoxin system RelE/ParE family toxin n=1 Tax=Ramlibacter sp. Leaf400 TaxID=1736365 RepID=UPI002E0E8919